MTPYKFRRRMRMFGYSRSTSLRKHNPSLTLPSNVVLDSVRYGGILSLGCHGAATHTWTLPDLVSAIKIVDATGTLHTFTEEKDLLEFSAATVNLNLLGIMFKLHVVCALSTLSRCLFLSVCLNV